MSFIGRKLIRKYKAGYEIWDEESQPIGFHAEVISDPDGGAHALADAINETVPLASIVMRSAFTPAGHYIGNPKNAYYLCKKRGIRPELAKPNANVCSIGFCEGEQKWYGWSHRAIYGFGIGSKVEPGDCAYQPKNKEDFRLDCIRFWDEEHHEQTTAYETYDEETQSRGIQTDWRYSDSVPNKKLRGGISGVFAPYPDSFGRGEWTAETLEDAKQMAMDFAESVG